MPVWVQGAYAAPVNYIHGWLTCVPLTVTVTTPLAGSLGMMTASTLLTVSGVAPPLPLTGPLTPLTTKSRLFTRGFADMGSAGGSVHTSTTCRVGARGVRRARECQVRTSIRWSAHVCAMCAVYSTHGHTLQMHVP